MISSSKHLYTAVTQFVECSNFLTVKMVVNPSRPVSSVCRCSWLIWRWLMQSGRSELVLFENADKTRGGETSPKFAEVQPTVARWRESQSSCIHKSINTIQGTESAKDTVITWSHNQTFELSFWTVRSHCSFSHKADCYKRSSWSSVMFITAWDNKFFKFFKLFKNCMKITNNRTFIRNTSVFYDNVIELRNFRPKWRRDVIPRDQLWLEDNYTKAKNSSDVITEYAN